MSGTAAYTNYIPGIITATKIQYPIHKDLIELGFNEESPCAPVAAAAKPSERGRCDSLRSSTAR